VEGRENLSVIRSSVMIGFSLHGTLGEPAEAAERLLSSAIAPPGSGKLANSAVIVTNYFYLFDHLCFDTLLQNVSIAICL